MGCVVRAKSGELRKEDVQVKVLDPMNVSPTLDSTEVMLSNILMITLSDQHIGRFQVKHYCNCIDRYKLIIALKQLYINTKYQRYCF